MTKLIRHRLWLLGPARVDQTQKAQNETAESEIEGTPRFRSRRTVALLGYLAAERRSVARDLLAALFWPDEEPARGRANLRRELHNLTKILPGCWELDRQAVTFMPSADTTVDLYQLQDLEADERWGEAAELLGGEFIEGLYLDDNPEFESWLLGEREHWRGRAEAILVRVIDAHIQRGRYSDALHHTQRLLQFTPWNENAHRQAMRLLAWTGKRGAALRQFETCKQVLSEELDVEPASETIALYQKIHAGQLDLPPQLPAFLTEEKARREFERALFVGRKDELSRLETFLTDALAGESRVVLVTGGPGLGKTALLEAFVLQAMEAHPNLLVAYGKCTAYSGQGDPYLPFRDVMRMLTGDVEARWDAGAISRDHARRLWTAYPLVVQALLDHGPGLLDVLIPSKVLLSRSMAVGQDYTSWLPRLQEHIKRDWMRGEELEQSHLFQQTTDLLCNVSQEQPLLLILDDLQWADAASISLLFHLGRSIANAEGRLLIACAYRPEEVAMSSPDKRHPLAKPLQEFKRAYGDVWVDLDRSEATEDRSFVGALLDAEPNRLTKGFREALFQRTEGHPLFTVELLRSMQERGDLRKDEDGHWIEGPKLDWEVLPARVEAVIEERIGQLDPELQELISLASVEGEVFTAHVLAEVLNVSERYTLRRLSQDLEQEHRLVSEQEEIETAQRRISRYRFSHILFQDYLYKHLSQGEKRLFHGDIAATLEVLYEGQLDEMAVQLAHHFYQAGDHKQAFHYSSMAAERAARVYDSGEAITHYTRAIQLAETVSPDVTSLARLHRGRGLALEKTGNFDQAQADHIEARQMAQAASEQKAEWRALIDLGRLWASRDYNQTRDFFEAALELARQMNDQEILAGSLNWIGNWYANDEKPLKAIEFHHDALKIVEQLENRQDLANTLDLLGLSNLLSCDLSSSVQYYDRAIMLYRELGDYSGLASSLIGRATIASTLAWLVSIPATPAPDAISDFEEALQIADEIGLAPGLAWAHYSLGMLYMVRGDFGRALKEMQSGLHIASEIEHHEYIVGTRFALGMLYVELFATDQALGELEDALILAQELRSPTWVHIVSGTLAGAYLMLDDPKSAHTCLEKVISPQTPMDTLGKRNCWLKKAELALAQGDPALALDITGRLIASAPNISPGQVITFLWKLKGEALAATGCINDALPLLHAALINAEAAGERFLLWRVHACLGRLYHDMGDQQASKKEIASARAIIDEMAATVPDERLKANFHQGAYNKLRIKP